MDAKPVKKRYTRRGAITTPEKELIAQVVMDQPSEMQPYQVNALAKALRRSRESIKTLVEEARDNFVASAGDYVTIHKQAAENALEQGQNDVAAKAAQWALTSISAEGARIVDKPNMEAQGSRIMIGIKVGNIDNPATTIALATSEPEKV